MIPYGRQNISDQDIDAVISVLKSDFLTQGPVVPNFEKHVAQKVGAAHAVAVNSATSALHIACLALGLSEGDYLWTTPVTFVASANCGIYCGAKIDFVDIDLDTYNISITALEKKLLLAEKSGNLPKVIVVVHLCGQSCDMKSLHELSKRFGFKIIEDASHAIGGKYNDEYIGNCRFSEVSVFSFHPVKIITSAEGGMALTNDPEIAKSMRLLHSHGITRDPGFMDSEPHGPWFYEQIELGFNYRMTEIQAALGLSQLKRLDSFVSQRHFLAERYLNGLSDLPVFLPKFLDESYSSFHLFVIRLNLSKIAISKKTIFEFLRQQGIGVNLHYIPVHTQPFYKRLGYELGDYPNAEQYYLEAITLPIHPSLTIKQQDYIIETLRLCLTKEEISS